MPSFTIECKHSVVTGLPHLRQLAPIEDIPAATPLQRAQDAADTNITQPQCTLHEQWQMLTNAAGDCTYYRLRFGTSGMCCIGASITVRPNKRGESVIAKVALH